MTALLRSRWLIPGLAIVVGLSWAVLAPQWGGFMDLKVYRFGGDLLLHGEPVYDGREPVKGLPFTYPPFAALVFAPLSVLPFWLVIAIWSVLSVAALWWSIRLFARPHTPHAILVAAFCLGLVFEPVTANLYLGQVNLFLIAALTWDLLRVYRADDSGPAWLPPGVLIGLAAGIKLTPLLFVVLLVLVGRNRAALIAVGTFLATVALGFLVVYDDAVAFWTDALWDPGRVGGVAFSANQSVFGTLSRLGGHEVSTVTWFAVAAPVTLAIVLVAAWAWRRGDPLWGIALTSCAMLLASPISWNHHWSWVVPITLLILGDVTREHHDRRRLWAAGAWVVLFTTRVIVWPPSGDDAEYAWTWWQQVLGNAYVLAVLALVAVKATQLASAGKISRPPRDVPAGR